MTHEPNALLPCPFCGGKASKIRGVFRGDGSVMEWDGETHIYCTTCSASVCVGTGGNIDLDIWNTRHPVQQAPACDGWSDNDIEMQCMALHQVKNCLGRLIGEGVKSFHGVDIERMYNNVTAAIYPARPITQPAASETSAKWYPIKTAPKDSSVMEMEDIHMLLGTV